METLLDWSNNDMKMLKIKDKLPKYVMPKYDGINIRRIGDNYYTRDNKLVTDRLRRYDRFIRWEHQVDQCIDPSICLSFELCYGTTATDVAQVWSKDGIHESATIFPRLFAVYDNNMVVDQYNDLDVDCLIPCYSTDKFLSVVYCRRNKDNLSVCKYILNTFRLDALSHDRFIHKAITTIEGLVFKDGLNAENYKWKPLKTADLAVHSITIGEGRNSSRLGSITLCDANGRICGKCGTGFSDNERDKFWASRHLLLGKIVEIRYQHLSKHSMLVFPTFVRVRHDKTLADSLGP